MISEPTGRRTMGPSRPRKPRNWRTEIQARPRRPAQRILNQPNTRMQPIDLKPAGSFRPVAVPRHVVQQRVRAPKQNIPQTGGERNHILQAVRHYVAEFNPIPPMPADELRQHADKLVEMLNCDRIYSDYI